MTDLTVVVVPWAMIDNIITAAGSFCELELCISPTSVGSPRPSNADSTRHRRIRGWINLDDLPIQNPTTTRDSKIRGGLQLTLNGVVARLVAVDVFCHTLLG